MTPRRVEPQKTWGSRVSDQRQACGFTQAQLAEHPDVAVSQQTISKIELNLIQPRMPLQKKLVQALKTTHERLFPWSEFDASKAAGDALREPAQGAKAS